MAYFSEQRKYQRCGSIVCKAMISTDSVRWSGTDLVDLSAGGLSFTSKAEYKEGEKVCFNLYIYNMLSEFNIRAEGRIVRIDNTQGNRMYGVRFENLSKYSQVQLDELVKSRVKVGNAHEHTLHDELYSLILLPRIKPRHGRMRIRNYR